MKRILIFLFAVLMILGLSSCQWDFDLGLDSGFGLDSESGSEGTIYTAYSQEFNYQVIVSPTGITLNECETVCREYSPSELSGMGLSGTLTVTTTYTTPFTVLSFENNVVTAKATDEIRRASATYVGSATRAYKSMLKKQLTEKLRAGSITYEQYEFEFALLKGEQATYKARTAAVEKHISLRLDDSDCTYLLLSRKDVSKIEHLNVHCEYEYEGKQLVAMTSWQEGKKEKVSYYSDGKRKQVEIYLENGVRESLVEYYEDGEQEKCSLRFDENQNITEGEYYNENGELLKEIFTHDNGDTQEVRFERNENGEIVKKTHLKNGKFDSIEEFIDGECFQTLYHYDDNKTILFFYDPQDNLTDVWVYTYAEDGSYSVAKHLCYDNSWEPNKTIETKYYDADGNQTAYDVYNYPGGGYGETTRYSMDQQILQVSGGYYGRTPEYIIYYSYRENSTLLQTTQKNANGISYIRDYNEQEQMFSEKMYGSDGSLREWYDYKYYSNGNLKSIHLNDVVFKKYYENGALQYEAYEDSIYEYYEDGTCSVWCRCEDGIPVVRYEYYRNGQEKNRYGYHSDGSVCMFYSFFEDGTEKHSFRHDIIIHDTYADGTIKMSTPVYSINNDWWCQKALSWRISFDYDEKGRLIKIREIFYDVNGNITSITELDEYVNSFDGTISRPYR
jgi:antitoxin component YwqK of YwqJK toxin-antitoxin module